MATLSYTEYNLCCFSPSGNAVKYPRLNFVWKCFTAWSLSAQLAILQVWSSTLDVWLASILNLPLKAALSDIIKILVIANFNLTEGFWLYLKIPFLVKTKIKVGQMNWWTKLTNNIVIRSLYNVPNKQILLSQWKLPCSVAATLFSSRDLVFPEVRRNVVRKSVVGLLQVNV